MNTLYISWNSFKQIISIRTIYYYENDLKYVLVLVTKDFINICEMIKNIDVDDINDFEINYKNQAIKTNSIDDAIILSYKDLQ